MLTLKQQILELMQKNCPSDILKEMAIIEHDLATGSVTEQYFKKHMVNFELFSQASDEYTPDTLRTGKPKVIGIKRKAVSKGNRGNLMNYIEKDLERGSYMIKAELPAPMGGTYWLVWFTGLQFKIYLEQGNDFKEFHRYNL